SPCHSTGQAFTGECTTYSVTLGSLLSLHIFTCGLPVGKATRRGELRGRSKPASASNSLGSESYCPRGPRYLRSSAPCCGCWLLGLDAGDGKQWPGTGVVQL